MSGVSVGDTVVGCRIEAVAGRGGMGVVFRALQLSLDRTVALKAIAPALAGEEQYRARFQREARLAAVIEHPNVLPVYEAGELASGELYLIMRWVEGTDLRQLLASERRVSARRAVTLLVPVARALEAAHARGLVHRDIKPANVLVAAGEHVYLTDFGVARLASEEQGLTKTGAFVGTFAYAAPERMMGGADSGPAGDIYSLGCMLFEVLTGRGPFTRDSELATIQAHVNDRIPSARAEAADVPAALDEVVRRALAKAPADRFSSAGEMADAMEASLAAPGPASDLDPARTVRTESTNLRPPTVTQPPTAGPKATQPQTPAPAATQPRTTVLVETRRRPRWPLIGVGALLLGGAAAAVIAVASSGGAGPSGGTRPTGRRTGAGQQSTTAQTSQSAQTTGTQQTQSVATSSTPGPPIRTTPVGQLPDSDPPGALALVSAGAAVAIPSAGRVMIIRRGATTYPTAIVGADPSAIAADPSGRLWVTDTMSNDVRVIDPNTMRTIATIPSVGAPDAIAIGGGRAWIADRSTSTIRAVDLRTMRTAAGPIASGGRGPVALAYGPQATLWVVNAVSSTVTAIRGGRAGRAHRIAGGPISIAAGASGVWVGTQSGDAVPLSLTGAPAGKTLAFHAGAVLVALVANSLLVTTQDDGSISLLTASGPGSRTILSRMSLSPIQHPAALVCAPNLCVASDETTRQVVSAGF